MRGQYPHVRLHQGSDDLCTMSQSPIFWYLAHVTLAASYFASSDAVSSSHWRLGLTQFERSTSHSAAHAELIVGFLVGLAVIGLPVGDAVVGYAVGLSVPVGALVGTVGLAVVGLLVGLEVVGAACMNQKTNTRVSSPRFCGREGLN